MPNVPVFDMNGNEVGSMELNEAVFGQEVNKSVLHQVVVNYLANQRQGTQNTKTRAEVSGGGIKPWRQKGTGRARQGSTRSPQWRHGGVALGPKPRSYRFTLNKKLKRVALKSALSQKVLDNQLIVLDSLNLEGIKTRTVVDLLKALKVEGKALIVTKDLDQTVVKSARNIPGVDTTMVGAMNVYEILNHGAFVVTKEAVLKIEEVYAQ